MVDRRRQTPSGTTDLHRRALAQVRENAAMLRPGMTFEEAAKKALCYPPDEFYNYGLPFHGVGLCDEYPSLPFGYRWQEAGHNGVIMEGMTICAESYVGRIDGGEGVKYEDQYLITANGAQLLSIIPTVVAINQSAKSPPVFVLEWGALWRAASRIGRQSK